MIVIAIIGILSAIAIPNFLSYRTKGQDTAAKNEANNFYSSAMAHFADVGTATTFSSDATPAGFAVNSDIGYGGSLVITGAGATTGTMTFSHVKSDTTYTMTGSTGSIQ